MYDAETEARIDAAGLKHHWELSEIRRKEAEGRQLTVTFETSSWYRHEAAATARALGFEP